MSRAGKSTVQLPDQLVNALNLWVGQTSVPRRLHGRVLGRLLQLGRLERRYASILRERRAFKADSLTTAGRMDSVDFQVVPVEPSDSAEPVCGGCCKGVHGRGGEAFPSLECSVRFELTREFFLARQDLAELASSRTIATSSSYASSSRAPPPRKEQEYDPLLGLFGGMTPSAGEGAASQPQFDQTLASLVQPSSSRIGLKLMRKMGWREGQGVGPRVSYEQRKRQAAEIGIRLEGEDADDADGEAAKHYYAPLDRPLTLIKGSSISRDKGWGLGYRAGMGLKETLRAEGGFAGSSKSKTMTYELDDHDVYGDSSSSLQGLSERQKRSIGTMDDDEDSGFTAIRSSRDQRARQVRTMTHSSLAQL